MSIQKKPRPATVVRIYNVDLTLADTEYDQVLPAGTVAVEVQCRTPNTLRMSFFTGKVAIPTPPYWTIKAGSAWFKNDLLLLATDYLTIYLGSDSAGVVAEIICWGAV